MAGMTKQERLLRKKYLCRLLDNGHQLDGLVAAYGFTEYQVKKWPATLQAEEARFALRKNDRLNPLLDAFDVKTLLGLRSKLMKEKNPFGALINVNGIGKKTALDILSAFRMA